MTIVQTTSGGGQAGLREPLRGCGLNRRRRVSPGWALPVGRSTLSRVRGTRGT
jgi:hypothetical protein